MTSISLVSCADGGYLASPYLPLEPEEAITTGQYSSQVKCHCCNYNCNKEHIMIKHIIREHVQVDVLLGFMSDETLIGTQWFYSAPGL